MSTLSSSDTNARCESIKSYLIKRKNSQLGSGLDDESDKDCEHKFAKQNHSEIEKRRRDKMNSYIMELSTMIPMCNAMNRKLDKLTVLRMAVQHVKVLKGAKSTLCSETFNKPAFLSDDDLKHLILKSTDGFLFVVTCNRGRLLFISESVKDVLNYNHSEILGQSFFDLIHPNDIQIVKEHLSSSDFTPKERLIDAKTFLPMKAEMPAQPSQLSLGARRSFFCRIKTDTCENSGIKIEKDLDDDDVSMVRKKNKSDKKNFAVVHCTGFVKSWSPANLGIIEDSEGDGDCNVSCLVAVGRVKRPFSVENVIKNNHIKLRPIEFMSRHTTDGKFTFVDLKATTVLGFLPQELMGTSIYEYYHLDDLSALANTHKEVLKSKEPILSPIYRFKTKDKTFIHLRTKAFSFRNPWTKEIESVVATNTVVIPEEVSSSGLTDEGHSITSDNQLQHNSSSCTQIPKFLKAVGTTHPGAGRVGRQIAEDVLEKESYCDTTSSCNEIPQINVSYSSLDGSVAEAAVSNVQSTDDIMSDLGSSNCTTLTFPNRPDPNLEQVDSILEQNTLFNTEMYSDGSDDAAMAVLMSLLEADAGLGGPVGFSDIPWPL